MTDAPDEAARRGGQDALPEAELERRVELIGRILRSFGFCDDDQVISSLTSLWGADVSEGSVQLDSVDTLEVLLTLEEECGLAALDPASVEHILTVGDLASALEPIA